MSEPYNHKAIEKKWQEYWKEHETFKTDVWDFSKPKYYALDMFPYPSGVGLHAGHPEGYTATDIMSRMKRMQGYNVLHPMGYDSFGLPAEQYAVNTGHHPNGFTQKNIETFSKQLRELGFDYDWSKMISTSDPEFYKWTQWIFKKLYEAGYAKHIDMPVNWCEELGTVLSNDEVIDGKSERGGYPVVRKNMKQWVIDQPAFAEKLLEGLDEIDQGNAEKLDWQEHRCRGQIPDCRWWRILYLYYMYRDNIWYHIYGACSGRRYSKGSHGQSREQRRGSGLHR